MNDITKLYMTLVNGKVLSYGNINLLSKVYEEDVVIRVSRENTYV